MIRDRESLLHKTDFGLARSVPTSFINALLQTAYYASLSSFPVVVSCSFSTCGESPISVQQNSSEFGDIYVTINL